jgi:ZIP family zinc transporter/zinc and cadmium transporter
MILNVLVYSLLAGLATLIGIGLLGLNEKRALRYSHYLNSFAGGVLLAVAFFHQMPEAAELAGPESAFLYVAFGFACLYILESILVFHSGVEIHYHGEREEGRHRSKALVAFTGLAFHSLLDGLIIAVGFGIDKRLGVLMAISVILHEVPEGTTSFSLLMGAMSRKAALWMSVIVAVATPVGAVLSLVAVPELTDVTTGRLLALAAGSFLYIAASDLVPETHGKQGLQNALCLLGGGALIYAIGRIAGEAH